MDERRFRVMGTDAHVIVVGGAREATARAAARLDALEQRWSRFLPDSELSRLNAADGMPCVVSADTLLLVNLLRRAWRDTHGRFDPTMHDALVSLGYERSWPDVDAVDELPAATAARGCAEITIDHNTRMVWLPAGLHLDAGGLGKGLAADLVAGELVEGGAAGAMVNVGGDLRVIGEPPKGEHWRLRVEHPADSEQTVAEIPIAGGGIATTSRGRRTWSAGGQTVHHVLDPQTGQAADRPWVTATVVAGTAWWAEALAKVAFLDGTLSGHRAAALFVDEDGTVRTSGDDAQRWFQIPEGAVA
jgi:thiamine biosynthesis lipoprotein